METLKKIGKGAIIFGMVGALLALSAPYIAGALSGVLNATIVTNATAMGTAQGVLWQGAFFSAFGALHGAVAPMLDAIFAKDDKVAAAPELKTPAKGHGHGVTIHNTQLQPDLNVDVEAKANLYTQIIEVQRAQAAGQSLNTSK